MGGRAEINKTTIQSRIDEEPESKWAALTVGMKHTAPTEDVEPFKIRS